MRCPKSAWQAYFDVQNVQSKSGPDFFLEVEMFKKCTALWREAHFDVKMRKANQVRNKFGRRDSARCSKQRTLLWRNTHFQMKITCSRHFWTLKPRFLWHGQGILHPVKNQQNVKFCSSFDIEKDLQRCMSRGRGSTPHASDMLRGPGADLLRGVEFWSISLQVC